jgi:hypothetical protein
LLKLLRIHLALLSSLSLESGFCLSAAGGRAVISRGDVVFLFPFPAIEGKPPFFEGGWQLTELRVCIRCFHAHGKTMRGMLWKTAAECFVLRGIFKMIRLILTKLHMYHLKHVRRLLFVRSQTQPKQLDPIVHSSFS